MQFSVNNSEKVSALRRILPQVRIVLQKNPDLKSVIWCSCIIYVNIWKFDWIFKFLAATAQSLHSINTGLVLVFPTLVIPAITGIQNEHNKNEYITMTASQSSWIGNRMNESSKKLLWKCEILTCLTFMKEALNTCFCHSEVSVLDSSPIGWGEKGQRF